MRFVTVPGAICRKNKTFFHCDAAQAVGKIPLDVEALGIDLMSISGHKLYGPKGLINLNFIESKTQFNYTIPFPNFLFVGVGALYVRRRPRVRIEPIQSGGGQERGIRSGTIPTPLVVGLGAACHIAQQEIDVRNISNERQLQ